MEESEKLVSELVDKLVSENDILIFSASYCPYCNKVKDVFQELKLTYVAFEIDIYESPQLITDELYRRTEQKTVPNVFINSIFVGGYDDIMKKYQNDTLLDYINKKSTELNDNIKSNQGDEIKSQVGEMVDKLISENEVMIFSATYCPYCTKVKDLFNKLKIPFVAFEIDEYESPQLIKDELFQRTERRTVPNVFIHSVSLGGCDDIMKKHENGTLLDYINLKSTNIEDKLLSTQTEDIKNQVSELINKLISENEVIIFSATYCTYCTKVKDLFKELNISFIAFEIDEHESTQLIKDELYRKTKQQTVPNVFINSVHMGGCDSIEKMHRNGSLLGYVSGKYKDLQYDLIIIGAGSGGIAAAKEATLLKKKVAIFNFVKPTPHGTTWGVGGTCVNVGCIPKKLMHEAAMIGENIKDGEAYGWTVNIKNQNHNWSHLINKIQKYIQSLNYEYIKYFKKNGIHFFNAHASFKDFHTILARDQSGKETLYTAHNILIATGGRPYVPDFPGSNYAITSDDLFSLKSKPQKILIIGGSYIALECAGFLHGLGVDCTVAVRSILLRGFDQQISEMIGSYMETIGIKILRGFVPLEIKKAKWGTWKYKVRISNSQYEIKDKFNLVLLATGRVAALDDLGLDVVGVMRNEKTGKIIVNEDNQTSCQSVYAVGDVQDGHIELTPLAIKAGQQVAQWLYGNPWQLDYSLIPTTVFTPLEYGTCGLSEEEAINIHGNNIECYHQQFQPYEWIIPNKNKHCYVKLICLKPNSTVIGFHVLGPNAGEITQGFSLALKLKASKSDFDQLIGIHPTNAEIFTSLKMSRAENPARSPTGC